MGPEHLLQSLLCQSVNGGIIGDTLVGRAIVDMTGSIHKMSEEVSFLYCIYGPSRPEGVQFEGVWLAIARKEVHSHKPVAFASKLILCTTGSHAYGRALIRICLICTRIII
jgi:hypothetical protein